MRLPPIPIVARERSSTVVVEANVDVAFGVIRDRSGEAAGSSMSATP